MSCAASAENLFRRTTGKIKFLERHRRHGWNILPAYHRAWGVAAGEAKALIGEVTLELISKDL